MTTTCKAKWFILVFRLDEDGDLRDEGGVQSFGLGVKSSLSQDQSGRLAPG